MADEQQETPQEPQAEQEAPQEQEARSVPYERFTEVLGRAKEAEKRLAALEEASRAQEEAGKSEIEKLTERLSALESAEKEARDRARRLEVAGKKGIPTDLVDRLRGESVEELEQDADALLAFLKSPEGPGTPPASRRKKEPLDISRMTPGQIRENKDKLWGQ